jgi:hypothetical protein
MHTLLADVLISLEPACFDCRLYPGRQVQPSRWWKRASSVASRRVAPTARIRLSRAELVAYAYREAS